MSVITKTESELKEYLYRDSEWRRISQYQKNQLGLTFDDDGEFYMNFNRDFLKYFGEVEIVHKTPAKMLEEQDSNIKYEVFHFKGEWSNRRGTAGGCGNDTISKFLLESFNQGNKMLLLMV